MTDKWKVLVFDFVDIRTSLILCFTWIVSSKGYDITGSDEAIPFTEIL